MSNPSASAQRRSHLDPFYIAAQPGTHLRWTAQLNPDTWDRTEPATGYAHTFLDLRPIYQPCEEVLL